MTTLPDTTRHRWDTTGTKSQRVAVRLDTWAARQPPETIVPASDVIITWFPVIAGQTGQRANNDTATVRRAIRLLADRNILHRNRDTGHYHVSATQPALGTPHPDDITPRLVALHPQPQRAS
jgi:hypothetical protein